MSVCVVQRVRVVDNLKAILAPLFKKPDERVVEVEYARLEGCVRAVAWNAGVRTLATCQILLPGQASLHQPRDWPSSPMGHLPWIPNTGTMYDARPSSPQESRFARQSHQLWFMWRLPAT